MVVRAVFSALLMAAAPVALADEVVLKNGSTFSGAVATSGNRVDVRLDIGTVSFHKDEVKEIRSSDSALEEFEQKRASVNNSDVAAVRSLAEWAESRGLPTQARIYWRRVLELQPNDARAHEKLGHKLHQGKWLDEEEFMRAQGRTKYFGEWLTADEIKAREEAMLARRAARPEPQRSAPELMAEAAREPERRDDFDYSVYADELENFAWSPWFNAPIYWGTNPYYFPRARSIPTAPLRAHSSFNLRPATAPSVRGSLPSFHR